MILENSCHYDFGNGVQRLTSAFRNNLHFSKTVVENFAVSCGFRSPYINLAVGCER